MKILLIEDNIELALTIKDELLLYYLVDVAHSGKTGYAFIEKHNYDLIILDIVLPDVSGIILCKRLRKEGVQAPILMLTGKKDVVTTVRALDGGADDYMTKPFAFTELLARIKVLFRRRRKDLIPEVLRVGGITFDLGTRKVHRGGREIILRKKELYLLECLMRNKGTIITKAMIMDSAWESESHPEKTNTVDVHIKHLRDKINEGFDRKLIITIPGIGYTIK